MSCISYAYNILVVYGGIKSISLGGLQADLNGRVWGGGSPPHKKYKKTYGRPKLRLCVADNIPSKSITIYQMLHGGMAGGLEYIPPSDGPPFT